MKIRTEEELLDCLDHDYAWRIKEISCIKASIQRSTGHAKDMSIRAGVTLLYAHWEGFIKNSAEYYICFVANQRKSYSELNPCFIALGLRAQFRKSGQSKKISEHLILIDILINDLSSRCNIPTKNSVNTRSNLNSEVFKDIVLSIGLNYADFELKEKLIDRQLLEYRNNVAHGQYLVVKEEDFYALNNEIITMMGSFKNLILNAACTKQYLRTPIANF